MKLRIGRIRKPRALDDLTAIEREQVARAGKAYDGADRPIEERIPKDDDDEQALFDLTLSEIEDDSGEVVYQVYTYFVDSGSIFKANTTDEVGAFIQFGLECEDEAFSAALADAVATARKAGVKDGVCRMSVSADDSGGGDGDDDDDDE